MNFRESSILHTPLSDPVQRYENGYRVVNIFLTNSSSPTSYSNLPDSSEERAFFEQEFNNDSLNLKWHVGEPSNGGVYKNEETIRKDRYISGFDVDVYKNNRDLLGESAATERGLIQKFSGIGGNSFNYGIEDSSIRSYSLDVTLRDYFGNTHTATLITKNPEPSANITSYENDGGLLKIYYEGSDDLSYLRVGNYSGLNESNLLASHTGAEGVVEVGLIPDMPNYLKIEPYDGFGYSAPISMSGYSLGEEKSFDFSMKIKSIDLNKKDGGKNIEFDMQANFENNPYVSAQYEISTSGSITGAEVGYEGPILLDNGEFNNTSLNIKNTGFNYTIDNSFNWQNSINTGELSSGDDNPEYGYWDGKEGVVKSLSLYDLRSGRMPIEGMFSMPINEPNSHDIKFYNGINFSNEYEKASSYLNRMGEMPAVILNESQANKVKSYGDVIGWMGLRRGRVGLMEDIFSENSINQNIFENLDFSTQDDRVFTVENRQGVAEENEYISNDVGGEWAWVNNSGTHIYQYVQEGQHNPRTYFLINIKAQSEISDDNVSISRDLFVLPIDILKMDIAVSGETLHIESREDSIDLIDQVNLYTGISEDFEANDDTLAQVYPGGEPISYNTESLSIAPKYFKANFYDFIGNTSTVDINKMYHESLGLNAFGEIRFTSSIQSNTILLDELYNNSEREIFIEFDADHVRTPVVGLNIQYTGETAMPSFLNAMIVGEPSISGVNLLFDQVPPEAGYVLNISSTS